MTSEDTNYHLNLVEGDVIETTVTNLNRNGAQVDTSQWSNVETATLREVSQKTSIAPGSVIYATVVDIDCKEAALQQKRGLYCRNHRPGDHLRVQGRDRISSSLVRASVEEFRNLNNIYVPGIGVEADVTVEIAKVRDGTAFGLPIDIHDPGLVPGRKVTVQTEAGNCETIIKSLHFDNHSKRPPDSDVSMELPQPSPVTGQAVATLTTETEEGIQGKLNLTNSTLPSPGETVTTSVTQGHDRTEIGLDDSDFEIRVKLDHTSPIDGTACLELVDQQGGVYQARLIQYTLPKIREDETYQARVYKTDNRARIEIGNQKLSIQLTHEIPTTGEATIRITDIDSVIHGKVEDEIEPLIQDDTEPDTTGVDMTNLSKF